MLISQFQFLCDKDPILRDSHIKRIQEKNLVI